MVRSVFVFLVLTAFMSVHLAVAAPPEGLAAAVKARLESVPKLVVSMESGSPNFQVVRLNINPIAWKGSRYGAVRFAAPADRPLDLLWLISDPTNFDEYHLVELESGGAVKAGAWLIYPPMSNFDLDDEAGRGRPRLSLPRPWDFFDLHMNAVPAATLVPGKDYVICFRFSDQRPTDILVAATFVSPLESWPADRITGVFGLLPAPAK
jgi:hypothetical protein